MFTEEVKVIECRKKEFPLEGYIQSSGFCVSSVLRMTGRRKVESKCSYSFFTLRVILRVLTTFWICCIGAVLHEREE